MAGFKEARNRALDVKMKKIILSHGKWENPWSSTFTDSLNIIDCCFLEVNEDVNVVANDVLVNCVGHEACLKHDETFVSEVDVLIKTYNLDIEQQDEVEGCISKSFNVVKIPKVTKVLSIVDVLEKGSVFKMRLIIKLNAHTPSNLPLDKLR